MRRLALFALSTIAAAAVVGAEPDKPDARMNAVLDNVLLLHVDGNASIPMLFARDGGVYYIYLNLKPGELNANYTRTATWKLQAEELCAVKTDEVMTCFTLPQLSVGTAVDTTVRALGGNGNVVWQEKAKVMLLKGRPAGSFTADTPGASGDGP